MSCIWDQYKVASFNHKGCAVLDQFGALLLQPAYFCGRRIAYLEDGDSVWHVRCLDVLFGLGLIFSCITLGWIGFTCRVLASFDKKTAVIANMQEMSQADYDPQKDTFRSLNWNVAAMPALCTRFNGNRPVRERMMEVVDYILDCHANTPLDTIAFEEAFTDEAIHILVEGLKDFFPHFVHHCGKNILGLSGGILFFSRFYIIDAQYHSYSNRAGTNFFSQKGCLAVVVDFGKNRTGLAMVTHLEAGGGGVIKDIAPSKKRTKLRKIDQLKELHGLYDTMHETYAPVTSWLAGDLNLQWHKTKDLVQNSEPPDEHPLALYHWTGEGNPHYIPGISQVKKDPVSGINLGLAKTGDISTGDYIMPRKGHDISPETHTILEEVLQDSGSTSDHFRVRATWSPRSYAV